MKSRLNAISGVTLFTPDSFERSAALVAFGVDGWTGESLSDTLRQQWNMIVKPLPHTREGLRISIPFFTLESEVDQLVDAIRTLAER